MKRFAVKALFLSLAAFLLFTLVARQVFAATTVSPSNMRGWAFLTTNTGIGSFVSGPLTAPMGSGSVRLFSGTQGISRTSIYRTDLQGSNLSSITNLDFWTFAQTTSVGYPKVAIDVTTDYGQDTLYYELQNQNQAPVKNVWQHWTNAQNGHWTAGLFPAFASGGTLSEYVALVSGIPSTPPTITNAVVGNGGGFRFEIGPASTPDVFDGNVDNFTFNGNTYDFEPDVLGVTAPTVTTNATDGVTTTEANLKGTANPNSDATTGWFRYATVDPGTCNDTFGTVTSPVSALGSGTSPVAYNKAVSGLSSSTQYFYCAIAGNGGGTGLGSVLTFTTQSVPAPVVVTNVQTNLTSAAATLNGSANPNGAATNAKFRYATVNPGTCNDTFGTATAPASLGSGTSAVAYNTGISGLSFSTTYYYCAIANNGTNGFGSVLSFATKAPPTVTTSLPVSVLSTAATLRGTANPNGAATTGWFRYATVNPGTCNDTFGIATTPGSLGAGTSAVAYNKDITGLVASTKYYYCAIANNGTTRFGTVRSFTTNIACTISDVNDDGFVDLTDALIILQHFGESGPSTAVWDVNGSGDVDLTDVLIVLRSFGETCT